MAWKGKVCWADSRKRLLGNGAAALIILITGLGADFTIAPIRSKLRLVDTAESLSEIHTAMGQGLLIGLLGGFRNVLADFLWLRTHGYWEAKDRARTEALIKVTAAVDPEPLFFWINGARILGYDLPRWQIREQGGAEGPPLAIQKRIRNAYALRSLEFLGQGRKFHPTVTALPIEQAMIYVHLLDNDEAAAQLFREAALMKGAPFFAGRICAELLRRSGHIAEAYEWLAEYYLTLPDDDPSAAKPVVLGRIRDLEDTLGIPLAERMNE